MITSKPMPLKQQAVVMNNIRPRRIPAPIQPPPTSPLARIKLVDEATQV
jgi:hypothetical protein